MKEEDFMGALNGLVARAPELSPLDAAVLLAIDLGVAADSRSFAKVFDVAHAFVLRAVSDLADKSGLVAVASRDARTQRTRLALTEAGRRLLSGEASTPAAA